MTGGQATQQRPTAQGEPPVTVEFPGGGFNSHRAGAVFGPVPAWPGGQGPVRRLTRG